MRSQEGLLLSSWMFWSVAYYMYFPFLSIFFSRFVPEGEVSLLYLLFQASSLPFPFVGARLHRRSPILAIVVGMGLSGLGLALLSLARNALEVVAFMVVNYSFYLALPSYYLLMGRQGEGTITRVWAFSILPSLFMPSVGGFLAEALGFRGLFLLSGVILASSFVPVLKVHCEAAEREAAGLPRSAYAIPLMILSVAMASPYIYLLAYVDFSLTKVQVGELSTLAEVVGMAFSLFSSYTKRKEVSLALSLLLFSLVSLLRVSPLFAVFFGLWEAVIPLSTEVFAGRTGSVDEYAVVVALGDAGWALGYLVDAVWQNAELAIYSSSLVALFTATMLLLDRARKGIK
ncbi:MAG: hypothetical protein K1T65_00575 [Candidatus Aramenus sp.]|nr:hypothetical protein [Candidatus Aramenus sp.]